jgi:hypothetical protein
VNVRDGQRARPGLVGGVTAALGANATVRPMAKPAAAAVAATRDLRDVGHPHDLPRWMVEAS